MTLRLLRPAPLLDLADMLAGQALPNGFSAAAVARAQGQVGRSWAGAREDGLVVVCAGLMPWAGGYEAWFLARRQAAAHMLDIVRWAQLTLPLAADDRQVSARVETAAGARLARAIGFREVGGLWFWERR